MSSNVHGGVDEGPHEGESDLSGTYARVLIIELLVIVALYGLGRYFG